MKIHCVKSGEIVAYSVCWRKREVVEDVVNKRKEEPVCDFDIVRVSWCLKTIFVFCGEWSQILSSLSCFMRHRNLDLLNTMRTMEEKKKNSFGERNQYASCQHL